MGAEDFVTQAQFATTLGFLHEIRADIKSDVADVRAVVLETKHEITTRMDEANHRTTKNEEAVEAATAQVEGLADQIRHVQDSVEEHTKDLAGLSQAVEGVQGTANHIDKFGCQQVGRHQDMVTTLVQAGLVTDGELAAEASGRARGRLEWTPRQRATLFGVTAGAVVLAVLGSYAIPILHRFIHWLLGTS